MSYTKQERQRIANYTKTARRIPPETLLTMMGGAVPFDESYSQRCVVGWALRAELARSLGKDVDDVSAWDGPTTNVPEDAAKILGGTLYEWDSLYMGADWDTPLVEEAIGRVLAGVRA